MTVMMMMREKWIVVRHVKWQWTDGFWSRSAEKDINNILKNVQLFFNAEF
jgi:hypothetical protein